MYVHLDIHLRSYSILISNILLSSIGLKIIFNPCMIEISMIFLAIFDLARYLVQDVHVDILFGPISLSDINVQQICPTFAKKNGF